MEKIKDYAKTRFSVEVLREAKEMFSKTLDSKDKITGGMLEVNLGHERWEHDSEDEFFADYRRCVSATYSRRTSSDISFRVKIWERDTIVYVEHKDRSSIESVFEVFEKYLDESRLPEPPPPSRPKPTIFIGHGRSPLWRDLKDHLHEKHELPVEAYETGARAGHAVRDILKRMVTNSSFACLIMTAEDETADGAMRARQNVVHEVGLFQGALGFDKAVVLFEEGTEEFSNIHGVEQIRFSRGNIKETFGEVLATLRREFPDTAD